MEIITRGKCTNCGEDIKDNGLFLCFKCRQKIKMREIVGCSPWFGDWKQCPKCGYQTKEDIDYCPKCESEFIGGKEEE